MNKSNGYVLAVFALIVAIKLAHIVYHALTAIQLHF